MTAKKKTTRRKSGAQLIAEERRRQVRQEGFSSDHDDGHTEGSLVRAGVTYAKHVVKCGWKFDKFVDQPSARQQMQISAYRSEPRPSTWPWDEDSWRPSSPIRDLVKVGALIAAEIDRRLRLEARERRKR